MSMKKFSILIAIAIHLTACMQSGLKKNEKAVIQVNPQKRERPISKIQTTDTLFKIDFLDKEQIDTQGNPLACIAHYTYNLPRSENKGSNKNILYCETTDESDRALIRINGQNIVLDRIFPKEANTDTKVYQGMGYTIFLTINSWEEVPADSESTLEKGILKIVSKSFSSSINIRGTSACDWL